MLSSDRALNKEVSLEYPLFQSKKGHYFIGQTPILAGSNSYAVAALVNPTCSNVNIYLNAITVTNISSQDISAEIYLKSTPSGGLPSTNFSCTNITIVPTPQPNGLIQSNGSISNPPTTGVSIFSRIIPSHSTTVIDDGQIIIPPHSCILVFLGGLLPVAANSTIVAFGWWEERIENCYCNQHNCLY